MTTTTFILVAAFAVTGFGIGLPYGIAIGARSTRLPSPGPVEQCDTGCALAALPRNRDLIVRTRPSGAGPRTGDHPVVSDPDSRGPGTPQRRRRRAAPPE